MEKMIAVVKQKPGAGALLDKVEIPQLEPEEVLVKVNAAALCGTDLHIYEWNTWARNAGIKPPQIMGHEFSGDIVQVGSAVTDLSPGDYIAGGPIFPVENAISAKTGSNIYAGS